jgi:hypothetical protein
MARITREKRGFFGKLFLVIFFVFNGLMAWWLIDYWGRLDLGAESEAARAGAALGATLSTGFILFIWALGAVITGLLAILTRGREVSVETSAKTATLPCPFCAEPIHPEAKICPHCRSALPQQDLAAMKEYPEVYKGIRFRRQHDGTVAMYTAEGPRVFQKWADFWKEVE